MGQSPTAPFAGGDRVVEWTDWPARRQPGRAALAGVLLVATVGAVATVEGWLALVAAVLLLLATGEVLLPTRYRLDPGGAQVRSPVRHKRLAWDRVEALQEQPRGLLLRARAARPWLARRRSLLLVQPPAAARALLAQKLTTRP